MSLNRFLSSNQTKRVVVGMSGGIDSAVTAYLLKLRGFQVIGLHMINWDHGEEAKDATTSASPSILECFEKDYQDVQNVCRALDVPSHQINFVKEYWNDVFAPTLEGYDNGITPNPDVLCNRHIKFDCFLNYALDHFQADYVATGHYARLESTSTSNTANTFNTVNTVNTSTSTAHPLLLAGTDATKDQSYFLSGVRSSQLSQVLFPLGHLKKSQVRNIADISNLPTLQTINQKKESYGMCFVGKRNFKHFIHQYIPKMEGPFIDIDTGQVLRAKHLGFASYTIGQGARIEGMPDKWFVVDKKVQGYQVYVCKGSNHAALFKTKTDVEFFSWVDQEGPPKQLLEGGAGSLQCQCRIRYRSELVECTVTLVEAEGGRWDCLHVAFEEGQKAVAPGQILALYWGDVCLGGGSIAAVETTL